MLPCDVAEDESITALFTELEKSGRNSMVSSTLSVLPPADQLDGDYVDVVTRDGFKIAHDISAYSFVAMAKACRSMLNPGSALLTPLLPGRRARDPELQRNGSGQSLSGS
ncbi:SDR family oxidoreductase [Klebsiella variicola subsp. variicola]|nr:SDR family oxidoreductase [Klebsiella variicola subsp. variicola]